MLTAHVPNIQFETSGFLLALVHFGESAILTSHTWHGLCSEGATDTNVRLYCSKTQE